MIYKHMTVIRMINKTVLIMLNLDKLLQENDTCAKMDKVIKDSGTKSEFVGLITVWLVSLTSITHTNTDQYT